MSDRDIVERLRAITMGEHLDVICDCAAEALAQIEHLRRYNTLRPLIDEARELRATLADARVVIERAADVPCSRPGTIYCGEGESRDLWCAPCLAHEWLRRYGGER